MPKGHFSEKHYPLCTVMSLCSFAGTAHLSVHTASLPTLVTYHAEASESCPSFGHSCPLFSRGRALAPTSLSSRVTPPLGCAPHAQCRLRCSPAVPSLRFPPSELFCLAECVPVRSSHLRASRVAGLPASFMLPLWLRCRSRAVPPWDLRHACARYPVAFVRGTPDAWVLVVPRTCDAARTHSECARPSPPVSHATPFGPEGPCLECADLWASYALWIPLWDPFMFLVLALPPFRVEPHVCPRLMRPGMPVLL